MSTVEEFAQAEDVANKPLFAPGQPVWGKRHASPDWPAMVVDPKQFDVVPNRDPRSRPVFVRYFTVNGLNGELAWLSNDCVSDFITRLGEMCLAVQGKAGTLYGQLRGSIRQCLRVFPEEDRLRLELRMLEPASPASPEESVECPPSLAAVRDFIPAVAKKGKKPNARRSPTKSKSGSPSKFAASSIRDLLTSECDLHPSDNLRAPREGAVVEDSSPEVELETQQETPVPEDTSTYQMSRRQPTQKRRYVTSSLENSATNEEAQETSLKDGPQSKARKQKSDGQRTASVIVNIAQQFSSPDSVVPVTVFTEINSAGCTIFSPTSPTVSATASVSSPLPMEVSSTAAPTVASHLIALMDRSASDQAAGSSLPDVDVLAGKYRSAMEDLTIALHNAFLAVNQPEKPGFPVSVVYHFHAVSSSQRSHTGYGDVQTAVVNFQGSPSGDFPLPDWLKLTVCLITKFHQPKKPTASQPNYTIPYVANLSIDPVFLTWMSGSDRASVAACNSSIEFSFPPSDDDQKHVDSSTFPQSSEKFNIKFENTLHSDQSSPAAIFPRASLTVKYLIPWRTYLKLQICSICPDVCGASGFVSEQREMVEDRIGQYQQLAGQEKQRRCRNVTLVSREGVEYIADLPVLARNCSTLCGEEEKSAKRIDMPFPAWLVESLLVAVYDASWVKFADFGSLLGVLHFSQRYGHNDMLQIVEVLILERLVRSTSVLPVGILCDAVLKSELLCKGLIVVFEENSRGTKLLQGAWSEIRETHPHIPQLIQLFKNLLPPDGTDVTEEEFVTDILLWDERRCQIYITGRTTQACVKEDIQNSLGVNSSKMRIFDRNSDQELDEGLTMAQAIGAGSLLEIRLAPT